MRWQLVDRIDTLDPGERASGVKCFTLSEPFFEDHFPDFPVVPGVLLLESLAQLSGKLIGYTVRIRRGDWPFPILSMMNTVKFRKFVRPGEPVELRTSLKALRDEMAAVAVSARVNGRVTVQAEQIFVFNAVPLPDDDARKNLETIEFQRLRLLWADCPPDILHRGVPLSPTGGEPP